MSRTYVIVEAGSCHDGELDKAFALIDAAAAAGADAAKFQFWSNPERLAARRNAPEYLDVYRRYAVPVEWLPRLRARTASRGMDFLCTTYLPEDIAVVEPHVLKFKISSFEAKDKKFIEAHDGYGKDIIVSVGMSSTLDGDLILWSGRVYQLHCVSAYPAPLEDLNLGVIRACGLDGFSDHTGLVQTGGDAVLAGAKIIEVHLKLEETDPANPDAGPHALFPAELRLYVHWVRRKELILGDGHKRLMLSESAMAKYQVKA